MNKEDTLVAVPLRSLESLAAVLQEVVTMVQDDACKEEIIDTINYVIAQVTYFADIYEKHDVNIIARSGLSGLYDMRLRR